MTKKAGQLLDVLLAVLVVMKIYTMASSPDKKAEAAPILQESKGLPTH